MSRAKLSKLLVPRLWLSAATHRLRHVDALVFGADWARYHALLREIAGSARLDSLLDVGCGASSPVKGFADAVATRIGVDAHGPALEQSRASGIHTGYVKADLLEVGRRFAPGSFDCVTLLEVIEHFPRAQGLALLDQCEQIAGKLVIVSTPNGYLPQPGVVEGNPFQEHLSGWTVDDFVERGYTVFGVAGWKPLRGILMRPRRPRWFTLRLSLLTQRWFESRPRHAFQLLCVKRT